MISRAFILFLLFAVNQVSAQSSPAKRDGIKMHSFHGKMLKVSHRKSISLKEFKTIIAGSTKLQIVQRDTLYSLDEKRLTQKQYRKKHKKVLKDKYAKLRVDTLVYTTYNNVFPSDRTDTLDWSSFTLNIHYKLNYKGSSLTQIIVQDLVFAQKRLHLQNYLTAHESRFGDPVFEKSSYAHSLPLSLSGDIQLSKIRLPKQNALKSGNYYDLEDVKEEGCTLFYLHRDVPYKMLVRLNQKISFERLLDPLTECDTFLKSKENYDLYFLCLKDYNRGLLGIDSDQKFQDFKPTDIINSEYVWIINLNGLLINRTNTISRLSHGNASASDLFSAYKSGELKFIDVERLH